MPPSPARHPAARSPHVRSGGGRLRHASPNLRTSTVGKRLVLSPNMSPVDSLPAASSSRSHPYSRPASPSSHSYQPDLSSIAIASEFWTDASSAPTASSSISQTSSPQLSPSSPSLVGGASHNSCTAVNTPDDSFASAYPTTKLGEQVILRYGESPETTDSGFALAAPIHIDDRKPKTASRAPPSSPEVDADADADADGEDDDASGEPSTSSAAAAAFNKTPRPANAWILYRSDKLKAIASGERMPPLDDFLARSRRSDAEVQAEEEASMEDGESSALTGAGRASNDATRVATKRKKKKKSKPNMNEVPAQELERIRQIMNHEATDDEPRSMPPQAEISKLISFMWKNESRATKQKYERLSDIRRMEHEALYPNYKYQPMRKAEKEKLKEQLKVEKKREKETMRLEKIERVREEKREKAREQKEKNPVVKPPKPPKPPKQPKEPKQSRSRIKGPANKSRSRIPPGGYGYPHYDNGPPPPEQQLRVLCPEQMPPNAVTHFDPAEIGFSDGSQVFWAAALDLPDYHMQQYALEPHHHPIPAAGPSAGHPNHGSAFPVQEMPDHMPEYLSFAPPNPPPEMGFPQAMPFVGEDGQLYYLQPEMEPMPYVFEPGHPMPEEGHMPASPNAAGPLGYQLPPGMANDLYALVHEQDQPANRSGIDLATEDPADLLSRWENLDAPIQDQYTVDASELSQPTLAQIAADWAANEYNGAQADPNEWRQEQADPQYVTIRVPYEHLRGDMTNGLQPPRNDAPLLGGSLPISPLNDDFLGVGIPLTTANAVNLPPSRQDSGILAPRSHQPSFAFSNSDELEAGFRLPSGVIASPFDLSTQDTQWKNGFDESAFMQSAPGSRKASFQSQSSRDHRSRVHSSEFLSPVPTPGGAQGARRKRTRAVGSKHMQSDHAM